MSKNKNMYGVICKSIHKDRNRRDGGDYPSTKFPIRLGVVNFLFFQIFICLAALMITPNVWAALTSLTVEASGDKIFRGGSDRLLIIFTVDDRTDDDGDPYTVTAENGGLIAQGTVSPNETVRILWDGSVNGQQLPDGKYIIKVVLDRQKREDEGDNDRAKMVEDIILDATPPRISRIDADGTQITEGSSVDRSISSITVTLESEAEGSPIDRSPNLTNVTLQDERGVEVGGSLSYDNDNNVLTFTLGNPLDTPAESGTYILEITVSDEAHNTLRSQTKFTVDDVVTPSLTSVATSRGRLTPGAGVNQRVDYVEATLAGSLDLSASSIRLIGPDDRPISGQQTQPSTNKIRWQLSSPLLPTGGLQDGEYTIEIKAGDQTETILVPFLYDNLAPELVFTKSAEGGETFNLSVIRSTTITQLLSLLLLLMMIVIQTWQVSKA